MGVYKEGKNWKVQVYYKDWQGNRKRKQKRGFRTKGEAKEWERDFLQQQSQGVDIEFGNFLEIYYKDMDVRLRENTMYTKRYIIDLKIKPYFEKKILSEITVADVRAWQNELLTYKDKNGKGYSPTYLKTVNCQLTAIFNYAMRYYNLQDNPCRKAGAIGKSKGEPKDFWMQEEFNAFLETVSDKPETRMAFLLLYWTGMRIGDDDDKIRLNQRKPSKYKGLSRFGPEKNLQRINKFMKERPTFYKKLIQMKENFRFYLRCFYCITKVVILQFNSEKQDRISS
ncbi:Arm DNA-binding domain-containing protein [[Ruminococcus] gnavus]|nr:Arm DNA-binding domain-containing protein [Mediterraneibacter gnavus]